MERVQAPEQLKENEAVPSLAPFPDQATSLAPVADLEALITAVRSTPGQAGRAAVVSLQDALLALPATEENGRLLLKLLDDHAFDDLLADDGSPTRELAVETLLRLGYPWALQIHPDELAWYRETHYVRSRNKWLLLLGIFGLGAVAEVFLLRLF